MTDQSSSDNGKENREEDPKAAFEFALGDEDTYQSDSGEESEPEARVSKGDRLQYIGDYEIRSEIASGAMGVVFRGVQRSLKRDVAIKMIHSSLAKNPNLRQRFRIEAEAVAALDHPNIVPIYEVGEHDGALYFSMRYLSGGSLSGGLPSVEGDSPLQRQRRVALVVCAIARAVHHAHQRGILHRDLKPSNILLDEFSEPSITDFGLAKFADKESGLTRTQATLGTPAYMSPEQAAGRSREISVASDVYSLGAVLYELLAGVPPFSGDSHLEIMRQAAEDAPVALRERDSEIDSDLEVICLKTLSKPPRLRYESALELAEDMERWLRGDPIIARPVSSLERLWLWAQRRPGLAAAWTAAILLLLVILIGLPLGLFQINQARVAEQGERNRAAKLLNRSRLDEANRLLEGGESAKALAYIASVVKAEPQNLAVAEKLLYNLTYRNWVLPESDLGKEDAELLGSAIAPQGRFSIALYSDGIVGIRDLESDTSISFSHGIKDARQVQFDPLGESVAIFGEEMAAVFTFPKGELKLAPFKVGSQIVQAFYGPEGAFLFFQPSNKPELYVVEVEGTASKPRLMSFPSRIAGLEFRSGRKEMAIIYGEKNLSVWNYQTGEQVLSSREKVAVATYWQNGDWLLASPDRISPRGQGLRWQLANGVVLDSNDGSELGRISNTGTWVIENEELDLPPASEMTSLGMEDVWLGFASAKGNRRPVGKLPFDQSSPGGQRLLRLDRRKHVEGRSVLEPYATLRHRVGDLEVVPEWPLTTTTFGADGSRLLLDFEGQSRSQIWDATLLRPLFEQEYQSGQIESLSDDGRWILRRSEGRARFVWKAIETAAVPTILPAPFPIEKGLFTEDGNQIVTIGPEGYLRVFAAEDLAPLAVSEKAMILTRFSKGGSIDRLDLLDGLKTVAVGTTKGSIQLWDAVRSQPLSDVMMLPETVADLRWLPESKLLITLFRSGSTNTAWVWDIKSGGRLIGADGRNVPPCLAISPNGRWLVQKLGEKEIRLWDVEGNRWAGPSLQLTDPLPDKASDPSTFAGFSSDSQHVFVRSTESLTVISMDDMDSSYVLESLLLSSETVIDVRFANSGKDILVGSNDGFVLYNIATGEARFPIVSLSDLKLVRVSPDDTRLVTAEQANEFSTIVTVWDLATGASLGVAYRHQGQVESLAVSADGQRSLLVGEKEIVLWNIRDQVVLFRHAFPNRRLSGRSSDSLEKPTAILSPDGNAILMMQESLSRPLSVWQFPRLEKALAAWGPELAEAVGQFRVASDGSLQTVGARRFLEIRDRMNLESADNSIGALAEWLVAHPDERTVSPFSQVRQSEYQNRLLETKTLAGLLEVLRRAPAHESAIEQLGQLMEADDRIPDISLAEQLELAGDLLVAFNAVVGDEFYSNERRLQIAELLSAGPEFGEMAIIRSRTSRTGWARLIRDWIDGGFPRRLPNEVS